jgi:hypothetical protein
MRAFYSILTASSVALNVYSAIAQPTDDLPPNTINCAAFIKRPDGNWYVGRVTTFDLGTATGTKRLALLNSVIGRKFNIAGTNLYDILERKCGGPH